MFGKSKSENQNRKIKIGKSKIKNKRLISSKTLRAMLTENTRTDCPELFTPPVWKTSCGVGKIQGNTSQYYYCCTADLTVMDSSQRVWASTFYIFYLPCFRHAGGQYLTSLLMLVVVTVALLLFNGAPRVWAEKYIFCAQNTDETATRL